jgi:hypothetical protein
MRRLPAAALLVAIALAVAACGGGSDDNDDPTPTSAPIETTEPTSGPSDAIRSVELQSAPAVAGFIDEIGGTYVQGNVLYADVTGDGAEDAVIPLSSGGTLGDVGFIVASLSGDQVEGTLSVDAREFGVAVSIGEDGKLVSVEPVPGPDDPECCPSQVRTTIYAGDGDRGLTVESSEITANPAGGPKTPTQED